MSEINRELAGRYLLKQLIGQGGMADVYLAEDEILKREVAVKVLRSSLTGDPIYITRFHREARAAATLSHKNIVAIYDVGEEDDLYFIVMEYIKGQTLKDLIRIRGALHYVEAIDIMQQVLSATVLAHSSGIIHRDLKPQNIMVTDSGVVKITDFGIASIQTLSQVTQTNTIMGSLHYLAPEIAKGEKATPQSDIYALGIVFYELLRGEVPFNGESPVNIALKHMRDEIPSVRDFSPSIPQSVENIIIKATAKNVEDRYLTAKEMLQDLQTCLSREDEDKISFAAPIDEPTIVANPTQLFSTEELAEDTTTVSFDEKIDEPVIEDKEVKKKKKWPIVLAAIFAVAAMAVAGFFLWPKADPTIPNVVGMTQAKAEVALEEAGFKVAEEVKEELSDEYEKGVVIQTDPEANTQEKKGTEITLTVSKGKWIIMSDYTGQTYTKAKAELQDLGFTVAIYEETNDEYEAGIVINQSISEGEKQDPTDKNKKITLTVSKGVVITVPSLYGENIDTAKKTLQNLGFTVKTKKLDPPTDETEIANMKINVVIKQSLDPYTEVHKKGTSITLYYYDHKPEIKKQDDTPDDNTNTDDNNTDENNQSQDDNNTTTEDTTTTTE